MNLTLRTYDQMSVRQLHRIEAFYRNSRLKVWSEHQSRGDGPGATIVRRAQVHFAPPLLTESALPQP